MLTLIDLRSEMCSLKIPILRIYGSLDNLVPKTLAKILDQKLLNTKSIIIKKGVHAPFISHKKEFCSILIKFKKLLII